MALKTLMEYVALVELDYDGKAMYHSFAPQNYPENVSQVPFKEDEQEKWTDASGEDAKCCALLTTRRYLPCHYFDFIGGSSTGA